MMADNIFRVAGNEQDLNLWPLASCLGRNRPFTQGDNICKEELRISKAQGRKQSTPPWDAVRHSPNTSSRQTGPRSADRRLVFGRCRMTSCTVRTSKSLPQGVLLCTWDMQT